jgi:site-specific DNA-methyltransferase (adenine-specific)
VAILDAQSGPAGAAAPPSGPTAIRNDGHGVYGKKRKSSDGAFRGDAGGAARFLYQSKAPNRDRWGWCHDCHVAWCRGDKDARAQHEGHRTEWHPTVKPPSLMEWLLRLVVPPGGRVIDPFAGTGTTGAAALAMGLDAEVVLIERAETYQRILHERLAWAAAGRTGP